MVAPNEKGPSLLLADGCALYLGKPPDTTVHAHYALQITLGLARSFRLELNGQVNEWGAAAIPSLEPHRLWCMGGDLLLLYLDPTSPSGRRVSAQLKVGDLRGQPVAEVADLAAIVARAFARVPATGSVEELVGLLVDRLAPPKLAVVELDSRLEEVLDVLGGDDGAGWSLPALAERVDLSPGRLRHLFKEQLGISIRSYKSWARVWRATTLLTEGGTLTDVAHEANFVDAAHLSRAFRNMFGITISELARSRVERVR